MTSETHARSGPFSECHRHVLATVAARGSLTVDELAAAVADALGDDRDAAVTRQEVALVHTHLPRLASAGLIEFDRERGLVRRRADTADAVGRWHRGGGADGANPWANDPAGVDQATAPGRWRGRRRTTSPTGGRPW